MAEKYLAEARQNEVNTMHEEGSEVEGVQMVQYFIKDAENGINPAGFEDTTDGSLFAEFHILNDEVWEAIKEGTYKGFSLEGIFNLNPILQQEQTEINDIANSLNGAFSLMLNNFKRKKEMSKMKRIKQALASILAAFASITTDKGVLVWDGDEEIKVGDGVKLEDSEGIQTAPEDGDYKTDDGTIIVVKDGRVEEIKEVEAVEEVVEEIVEFASIETDRGALHYEGELEAGVEVYTIGEDETLVPAEEGEYILEDDRIVVVAEGRVVEIREVEEIKEVEEIEELRKELKTLKKENAELKKVVAKLRAKPFAKPAHEEAKEAVKFEKTGDKGLDNLARLLNK